MLKAVPIFSSSTDSETSMVVTGLVWFQLADNLRGHRGVDGRYPAHGQQQHVDIAHFLHLVVVEHVP